MYVLSYFTNADESLHIATSADGFEFAPLNGGRPVLRGEVGTGALRDPFLAIGPDGLYHLLATDGWTSPSIVHASSADLLNWSPQRLVPVMAGQHGARNAWAPEFFTDPRTGVFHLIWSSVVDPAPDAVERNWQDSVQQHRIWHTATEDFHTFADARMFFDPGYPVIDATVRWSGDGFIMAFKDERGANDLGTAHKHILLTSFDQPHGPFAEPIGPVSPSPVEGPSLFRRGDEWVLIFDHFLENRYGALATRDLAGRWTPTPLTMPQEMRHASVIHIS